MSESASDLTSLNRVNVSVVYMIAEPGRKRGVTQVRIFVGQKVRGKKAEERPLPTRQVAELNLFISLDSSH